MKKVILVLILLIIVAAICFYFGWINVKPGTFGVAHSTISGTVDYPLESGKLHWLWQKIVPKSFHLYIIRKEPYVTEIEFFFPLPGNDELKEYGDFSLEGKAVVHYTVDFDTALYMLDKGIIDDFEEYIARGLANGTDDALSAYVLDRFSNYSFMTEEFDYTVINDLKRLLHSTIEEYTEQYSLREVRSHITFSAIPQVETYRKALSGYFDYLENLNRMKTEDLKRESEFRRMGVEDDVEIERLRKYGELITKYPVLLKYFYVQKFSGQTQVLVLPQDESTGFPRMLEPDASPLRREVSPPEPEPDKKPLSPGTEETIESPEGEMDVEAATPEAMTKEGTDDRWYRYLKFWEYFKK